MSIVSSDKWKCEMCFINNESSDVVCACCETARPGVDKTSTMFGAAAFAKTSSFAIPSLNDALSDSNTKTNNTAPIKFGFGNIENVAPSVSTKVSETRTQTHTHTLTDADSDTHNDSDNDEVYSETKILGLDEKVNVLFRPKQISDNKVAVGTLYMWGTGECDQLAFGDAELNDSSGCEHPKEVSLTNFEQKRKILPQFISIDCGALHTVGLTYDGKLWSWGCNDDLPLGRITADETAQDYFDGNEESMDENEDVHSSERFPDLVCNLPKQAVCKVSCGDNHTACLTANGDCYIWGTYKDSGGYIGFPDFNTNTGSIELNKSGIPIKVPLPDRCYQLRCGENHTVVLTNMGDMYVWGSGEFGQLAIKPMDDLEDKTPWLYPIRRTVKDLGVEAFGYIKNIYTGRATTFFVMSDGRVFGCGRNSRSEVGVNSDESVIWKPQELVEFKDIPIRHITGGQYFSCGISENGHLYTWGHQGHVGHGCTQDVRRPTRIMGIEDVVKVGAGGDAGYCITKNGHCYSWGEQQMYQLGNGNDDCEPALRPSLINPKDFGKKFVLDVAAGSQHAAALAWSGKYGTLPTFDRSVMAPVNKRRREAEENARRLKRKRNEPGDVSPPTETVSPPAKKTQRSRGDEIAEKAKGVSKVADRHEDEPMDEQPKRTKRGRSESTRSVSKPPTKSRAKQSTSKDAKDKNDITKHKESNSRSDSNVPSSTNTKNEKEKKETQKAQHKSDTKKNETNQNEIKKNETRKVETKQNELKKNELKKNETKKKETKKDEPKKDETKKDETKKDETKKNETKKDEPKKVDADIKKKKTETKKTHETVRDVKNKSENHSETETKKVKDAKKKQTKK